MSASLGTFLYSPRVTCNPSDTYQDRAWITITEDTDSHTFHGTYQQLHALVDAMGAVLAVAEQENAAKEAQPTERPATPDSIWSLTYDRGQAS